MPLRQTGPKKGVSGLRSEAVKKKGSIARAKGLPLAILLAIPVLFGVWLTAWVEGLSFFSLLGYRSAWFVFWTATAALGAVILPRLHHRLEGRLSSHATPPLSWMLIVVGVILALTLLVTIVAPPNNWDSMTYHNARVMEWWDHGDLKYWYTPNDRQLRMPPLASYLKLALFGLTGNDFLFNLVQWGFFALSIVAAFLLAARLSPEGRAPPLAALLVATLPMAILQSTSTQNDLVVAGYWLVSAYFFLRAFDRSPQAPTGDFLLGCAAVGLSWLTKGTALLFTGPMLMLALGTAFRRAFRSNEALRRDWLRAVAFGAALVILVNVGHWNWNRAWFSSITAGGSEVIRPATYLDAGFVGGLKLIISQVVRNSALQLDSLRLVGLSSDRLIRIAGRVHDWMGIIVDEPSLAFFSIPFGSIRQQNLILEDTAGCTWHFMLACGVSILACLNRRIRSQRLFWAALALGWLAWLGLCVTVKWMPWNQRLQLPILMWLMVPTACAIGTTRWPRWIVSTGAAFLLVAALPSLFFNVTRPLASWGFLPVHFREALEPGQPYEMTSIFTTSRWQNYFRGQRSVRPAVESVITALPDTCEKPSVVGLRIGGDSWEYALWIGARHFRRNLRFRHLPPGPLPPDVCAVIGSDCAGGEAFCLERTTPGSANE